MRGGVQVKKLTIKVTQAMIRAGGRVSHNCPVALALLATKKFRQVQVTNTGYAEVRLLNRGMYWINLPTKLKEWIYKYDTTRIKLRTIQATVQIPS